MEDLHALHIEGRSTGESWEPMDNYWEEFEHPLWKKSRAGAFTGGHGGMDWLVMRAFLNAVRRGIQTPIDAYDSATLMAVGILSEESIATGSAPVAVPDFTDGRWVKRDPGPKTIFSLEEVDDALYDGLTAPQAPEGATQKWGAQVTQCLRYVVGRTWVFGRHLICLTPHGVAVISPSFKR